MKFLSNKSVAYKFVFIVLVISSISLTAGEIVDYYLEKNRTVNSLIENTLLDARLISDYCVVPLEFTDKDAALKVLANLHSKPTIKSAQLFDSDNKLFAYYGDTNDFIFKNSYFNSNKEYRIISDIILAKNEIWYNNTFYGTLYIESKTNITRISNVRIKYSIIIGIGMLLVALLLASYFKKYITYPVIKLIQFTRGVSRNADYSQRIEKVYNDELGQLFDEFNNLLGAIQEANNKLALHQLQLESTVERRTLDLHKANKELEKAKNDAERANLIKSEFLSNMSHELRTPLNGIMGYAQILKTMGNLNEMQSEQVDIIHSSGQHLLSLINEILDYSKIEAKKLELSKCVFSFTSLLNNVLNIIRVRAEQKDLLLIFHSDDDIPNYVEGDELKVRQIIINLLSNAVKYTKTGTINFRVKSIKNPEHNIKIEVEDTGIGIARDKIEKIFEPFTQFNEKLKFVEGTGLGLAITRKLIELMNGKLFVESEENKGSAFTVLLNLPGANKTEEAAELHNKIIEYKGKSIQILAVDDILTNLSVITSALLPLGFNVITAQNGEQAIREYIKHKPQLILMDLVMPKMNGLEAIRAIRKTNTGTQVKIIGVTASLVQQKERLEFVSLCNTVLHKPIVLNEMFNVIRELLNIEWIYDDVISHTNIENFEQNGELLLPDLSITSTLLEMAETGDFLEINNIADNLVKTDSQYIPFSNKVKEFAAAYNSERLINYLTSLK